jgi:hypothetical protein
MNQPSQTGKRIVSKAEYVKVHMKRLLMLGGGGTYWLLGAGCAMLCAALVCSAFTHRFPFRLDLYTMPQALHYLWLLIVLLFGAIIFLRWGRDAYEQAKQVPSVIPHTRANTADLPAPDSLVRASEQPVQEQQVVLLRAAAQGHETSPEQLVRPAAEA